MISQERKDRVFQQLQKLDAYAEIQNETGRMIAALNFHQADRFLSHFALDREDVTLEYADEGVFRGREAVTAIVQETIGREYRPGEMIDLQLSTPMIEVAQDGETAEAVWWCPGAGAMPNENGDPDAIWIWGMIAADFVNENGKWKVWHFHYFRFIRCLYDKGWVEDTSMINRPNVPVHPLAEPTTYHNPYSPLSVRDGIPACPRPYETYTGPEWMLEKDKEK